MEVVLLSFVKVKGFIIRRDLEVALLCSFGRVKSRLYVFTLIGNILSAILDDEIKSFER